MLTTVKGQQQALDYLQRIYTTSEGKEAVLRLRAANKQRQQDKDALPHCELAKRLVGDVYMTTHGLVCAKYSRGDRSKTSVTPKHAHFNRDVKSTATPEQVLDYARGSLAKGGSYDTIMNAGYANTMHAAKGAGTVAKWTGVGIIFVPFWLVYGPYKGLKRLFR